VSTFDRRTFVQTAAVGSALAAMFASEDAQAAVPGYYVIAEIVAKPGSEKALRDLLVPFAKLSRKEPGCQAYVLMEMLAEPGRFLTYERWTNEAALKVHMTTPHIKAIVPKLEPVLAKPFTQLFLGGLTA